MSLLEETGEIFSVMGLLLFIMRCWLDEGDSENSFCLKVGRIVFLYAEHSSGTLGGSSSIVVFQFAFNQY